MKNINIELSEEEAQQFIAFRKHQADFVSLINTGVFNIRNGSAILSFNKDGVLDSVQITIIGFKRGLPIIQQILKV